MNEEQRQIGDLTQELLESILEKPLSDEVEFAIEGDMPIAGFFRLIQAGAGKGSELRKLKEKREEALGSSAGKNEATANQIPAGGAESPVCE